MISTLLACRSTSRAAGSSILRTRCGSSSTSTSPPLVGRVVATTAGRRRFLSTTTTSGGARPLRRTVGLEERAQLRAARKERATRLLQQQQQQQQHQLQAASEGTATSPAGSSAAVASSKPPSLAWSRWIWYLGLGIPTGLLVWGFQDEASPPAKFAKFIGLTGLIQGYTDQLAKPSYDKLLPDWSQVRTHPSLSPGGIGF